jgi:glycine/D-amino acid oxidase-like deaminating enzyme
MNRRHFIQAATAVAIATQRRSLWAENSNHVLVVGAGIVGASIGYHLARRGVKVTILEKEKPASGATGDSYSYINASRKQPRAYYNLNLLGIEGWRRLQQEFGSALNLQWCGGVEWRTPGESSAQLQTSLHNYQQWGYVARAIDEKELHNLLPLVTPGPIGAAAFYEEEAAIDPEEAVTSLLSKARQFGATIEYPAEVTKLDFSNGRIRSVQTARGRIDVDVVVLAAGAGTQELAKLADVEVPLSSSIGILAHTAPQKHLLDHVVFAPTSGFRQNSDGRIITSGNIKNIAGAATTPQAIGDALVQNAAQYLPALKGVTAERITTGHRVLPKDGFPVLGFDGKVKNLYIAVTHSGITLAPVIGEYAALEIVDGASVDLLDPYRPGRFAIPKAS